MEKKTRKSFIWLAILLLGTIWILAQRNKQIPYNSINGLVFGTVYNITYQYDGNLKAEIDAELKKFDGSLSPFNDTSVITRVNRNEEIVTDTFFQTCFNRSMEISAETRGAFDITVAPLANAWGFGFKKGAFPDSIMIDSLLQITGYQKVKLENGNGAIKKMFAAPAFRGEKQLGKKLLDTLVVYCKAQGYKALYLGTVDVLVAAQKFYKKHGFVECSKAEMPKDYHIMDVDNVFFKRSLTD